MNKEETLYRDLQLHLDKQTLGFPESESGVAAKLLKHFFNPKQAEIAMFLTYKYESLDEISKRAKESGKSIKETERILDSTAARGVIGFRKKNGIKQYRTIPYVVGMIEGAAQNPTPELNKANAEFSRDSGFWRAFLNTKVPQMRTIPIEKSITPEHYIGTYDEIKKIIKTTQDPIVILECVCRNGAERRGEPCRKTSRKETCMAFRDEAKTFLEYRKIGRQINKQEALNIMRKNEEDGLVLQPSNAQGPDFICSCCGCCCGILRHHKAVPNPVSHWATNYYAEIDHELCAVCRTCAEKCQVGAIKTDYANKTMAVDLSRCLGCGLCVASCPEKAIKLRNKVKETIPPVTGEEMMEVIMMNKV